MAQAKADKFLDLYGPAVSPFPAGSFLADSPAWTKFFSHRAEQNSESAHFVLSMVRLRGFAPFLQLCYAPTP
jgi:hypothetical protein